MNQINHEKHPRIRTGPSFYMAADCLAMYDLANWHMYPPAHRHIFLAFSEAVTLRIRETIYTHSPSRAQILRTRPERCQYLRHRLYSRRKMYSTSQTTSQRAMHPTLLSSYMYSQRKGLFETRETHQGASHEMPDR